MLPREFRTVSPGPVAMVGYVASGALRLQIDLMLISCPADRMVLDDLGGPM